MKYFTYALLITGTALAQSFTGVPVLKGSLKTKTNVRGTSSTCKVKVSKTRNLKEEDAFGNPGYRVILSVNLDGKNENNESVVKFEQEYTVTNFWNEGGKVVARDFEYFSTDGATLSIKEDGRLKAFSFPLQGEKITCSF